MILIVYHEKTDILEKIESIFKHANLESKTLFRETLDMDSYDGHDTVVVIGGDGTFLRASHLNKDIPMIGINPNPERKEGYFMQMTKDNYENKILHVIRTRKLHHLLRLECRINGKKLPEMVLNEVFIGHTKPYNMFNYNVEVAKETEFQRSSGIIVSTPAGSHAWAQSAGGEVMENTARCFQYTARELYEGRLTKGYRMDNRIIPETGSIRITCKSCPGLLVIDSISKEYQLGCGDVIEISASKYDIPVLLLK